MRISIEIKLYLDIVLEKIGKYEMVLTLPFPEHVRTRHSLVFSTMVSLPPSLSFPFAVTVQLNQTFGIIEIAKVDGLIVLGVYFNL